jgi:uroporphyrinogen-III synthase
LLGAAGFTLRRIVLYEAILADRLSEETQRAFECGEIDAGLFFSPRTAATFVRLATPIRSQCATVAAVALSPAVARALEQLSWRRILIAAEPNEAALLRALERGLQTEKSA